VPAGMEALPEGGFRLRFADGTAALPAEAAGSLAGLGSQLAAGPAGRVVVTGQASGPVADISIARRLSLARGLAVKQALAAGGLAPTRIDLRPMGRTADAEATLAKPKQEHGDNGLYQQAQVQAQWGNAAAALAALRDAEATGDSGLSLIKTDPMLDPIRTDPAFIALQRRLGLA